MSEPIKMTLSASLVLNKILTLILFTDTSVEPPVERNLPFSVKYKLQRAKEQVEKDVRDFEAQRLELVKQYGVEDPETHLYNVEEEKKEEFYQKLVELANVRVEHEFLKLKPEDVSDIDVEGVTTEEISVFMIALVDDEKLQEELNKQFSADTTPPSAEN